MFLSMCTYYSMAPRRRLAPDYEGNRDEMKTRRSKPPGRHWPDRPEIIAGIDETAGGGWLGVNDFGVVAAILIAPIR